MEKKRCLTRQELILFSTKLTAATLGALEVVTDVLVDTSPRFRHLVPNCVETHVGNTPISMLLALSTRITYEYSKQVLPERWQSLIPTIGIIATTVANLTAEQITALNSPRGNPEFVGDVIAGTLAYALIWFATNIKSEELQFLKQQISLKETE